MAVPCGLIINELVSNSLKHAFPEGLRGAIHIDISPDKKERYLLTVRDTGIGFPEELDFQNTQTLGLQLVNMLVKQLEGKIEMVKGKGTEFKISLQER